MGSVRKEDIVLLILYQTVICDYCPLLETALTWDPQLEIDCAVSKMDRAGHWVHHSLKLIGYLHVGLTSQEVLGMSVVGIVLSGSLRTGSPWTSTEAQDLCGDRVLQRPV